MSEPLQHLHDFGKNSRAVSIPQPYVRRDSEAAVDRPGHEPEDGLRHPGEALQDPIDGNARRPGGRFGTTRSAFRAVPAPPDEFARRLRASRGVAQVKLDRRVTDEEALCRLAV